MEFVRAFVVGGAICVVGQILLDFTKMTPARILVSFVTLGVVLGAFGVYEPLVKFAGAGATVPLTGFRLSHGERHAGSRAGKGPSRRFFRRTDGGGSRHRGGGVLRLPCRALFKIGR